MFKKKRLRSCISVFLAVLIFLLMLPISAWAAISDGGKVTVEKPFIANSPHYEAAVPILNANGAVIGIRYDWAGAWQRFSAAGTGDVLYCVQFGEKIDSGKYTAMKADLNSYFRLLSKAAKDGITYTSIYGFPNLKYGVSDDKAWLATQAIIWEFQTGLRISAGTTDTNGLKDYVLTSELSLGDGNRAPAEWGNPAYQKATLPKGFVLKGTQFYDWVKKDSQALTAYRGILANIRKHTIIPSFTNDANSPVDPAPTHTMKYNSENGRYEVVLKDTNNVLKDMNITSSDKKVHIERKSSSELYVWSEAQVSYIQASALQKQLPGDAAKKNGFILAPPTQGNQTMLCGYLDDPQTAYFNLETEDAKGSITINKTSDDGRKAASFNITGPNGFNQTVSTDESGSVTVEVPAGKGYTVRENTKSEYWPTEPQTVDVNKDQTSTVDFHNLLKHYIDISKVDSETGELITGVDEGTLFFTEFGIYAAEDIVVNGKTLYTKNQLVSNLVILGQRKSPALYPGKYYIKELQAPPGHILDSSKHYVDLTGSSVTVSLKIENQKAAQGITVTKRIAKEDIRFTDRKFDGEPCSVFMFRVQNMRNEADYYNFPLFITQDIINSSEGEYVEVSATIPLEEFGEYLVTEQPKIGYKPTGVECEQLLESWDDNNFIVYVEEQLLTRITFINTASPTNKAVSGAATVNYFDYKNATTGQK